MQSPSLDVICAFGLFCRVKKLRQETGMQNAFEKKKRTRVYLAREYHHELIFGNDVFLK